MKIKLLKTFHGKKPGTIMEVTQAGALSAISQGIAEHVKAEKQLKPEYEDKMELPVSESKTRRRRKK